MKLKLIRTGPGARQHYAWDSASRFFCGARFSWTAVDIEDPRDGEDQATCRNCRTVRYSHTEQGNLRITIAPRRGGSGYELFCQGIHLGWVTEKHDGHRTIMRASQWGAGEVIGYCDTVSEAKQQMHLKVLQFMFPAARKAAAA